MGLITILTTAICDGITISGSFLGDRYHPPRCFPPTTYTYGVETRTVGNAPFPDQTSDQVEMKTDAYNPTTNVSPPVVTEYLTSLTVTESGMPDVTITATGMPSVTVTELIPSWITVTVPEVRASTSEENENLPAITDEAIKYETRVVRKRPKRKKTITESHSVVEEKTITVTEGTDRHTVVDIVTTTVMDVERQPVPTTTTHTPQALTLWRNWQRPGKVKTNYLSTPHVITETTVTFSTETATPPTITQTKSVVVPTALWLTETAPAHHFTLTLPTTVIHTETTTATPKTAMQDLLRGQGPEIFLGRPYKEWLNQYEDSFMKKAAANDFALVAAAEISTLVLTTTASAAGHNVTALQSVTVTEIETTVSMSTGTVIYSHVASGQGVDDRIELDGAEYPTVIAPAMMPAATITEAMTETITSTPSPPPDPKSTFIATKTWTIIETRRQRMSRTSTLTTPETIFLTEPVDPTPYTLYRIETPATITVVQNMYATPTATVTKTKTRSWVLPRNTVVSIRKMPLATTRTVVQERVVTVAQQKGTTGMLSAEEMEGSMRQHDRTRKGLMLGADENRGGGLEEK